MSYLPWITDDHLLEAVQNLLNKAEQTLVVAEQNYHKNVVDPFSAVFQLGGYNLTYDEWLVSEKTRQAQKSLQNHIGDFHQHVLGGVDDWSNMGVGQIVDLVNRDKKILAEVKNKHNTVTGGNLAGLYNQLDDLVSPKNSKYRGYTAYYVTIIPKKAERFNIPFTPSDRSRGAKCASNDLIRIIDGASFYQMVTGHSDALAKLFRILPIAIADIKEQTFSDQDISSLDELFVAAYGTI